MVKVLKPFDGCRLWPDTVFEHQQNKNRRGAVWRPHGAKRPEEFPVVAAHAVIAASLIERENLALPFSGKTFRGLS